MITCRELISFLIEYLEGSLSRSEHDRFETHLKVCASCRAYLHTYETTIRLERAAAAEDCDPPEALVRAVMDSRRV